MSDDLKIIKKKFGEKMSQFCRSHFSTILEHDGLLSKILLDNYDVSNVLYDDLEKSNLLDHFEDYIYNLANLVERSNHKLIVTKTPKELLDEAGYILYECKTEDDIQKFKKYFAEGEELCTFKGGRLSICRVFFAVKKDVHNIRREDFINPNRQDLYGTSVISIQFTKNDAHVLSITNRYNHKVINPDATFSNDLDNIIEGLTKSFEQEYNLIQKYPHNYFVIPNYIKASDGKSYKYTHEINNIYYCTNNVIIDNFEVKKFPKEKYIVLDYFILDLQNKKITLYDKRINDSFCDSINDIFKIKLENISEEMVVDFFGMKMKICLNKKVIIEPVKGETIEIILSQDNMIIGYKNNNVDKIGDNFLFECSWVSQIEMLNLKEIGNNFMYWNLFLEKLYFPNLMKIGNNFLYKIYNLEKVYVPSLEEVGSDSLYNNVYKLLDFNSNLQEKSSKNQFR